jgi:lysophospholipase L1-like esterase
MSDRPTEAVLAPIAGPSRKLWLSWCRFLALAGVQVLLLGALLELLGRWVDPLGISYYPETARFLDHLILEEPIGYRLPPRLDERFWGVHVRTNSLGMRDREVEIPKPAGERRVMLLGDSGVFSLGVEYEDSIPARLEQVLNDQAPEGVHYRTLNMGVPSYNTEQELTQLESLGLGLAPDAVVLYFATNDIEPKLWVFAKRRNPLVDCAQRSYAASILYMLYRRVRVTLTGSEGALIQYSSYRADNPRWQAIDRSLRRIAELLRERRVPFLVVASGGADDAHMKLLRSVGADAGFPVGQLDTSRYPEWDAHPERFFISATNFHCNPAGCRIVAAEFARLMGEAGIR